MTELTEMDDYLLPTLVAYLLTILSAHSLTPLNIISTGLNNPPSLLTSQFTHHQHSPSNIISPPPLPTSLPTLPTLRFLPPHPHPHPPPPCNARPLPAFLPPMHVLLLPSTNDDFHMNKHPPAQSNRPTHTTTTTTTLLIQHYTSPRKHAPPRTSGLSSRRTRNPNLLVDSCVDSASDYDKAKQGKASILPMPLLLGGAVVGSAKKKGKANTILHP